MAADLKTFLDPSYQSTELRAFAFISAQFARGARTSVDCLLPFTIFAAGELEGQPFDADKMQKFLSQKYFLNLPLFVIEDLTYSMKKVGALVEMNGVQNPCVCGC
ncbi:hypothetical protein [Qipengyuania sp. JC766]|uniref:hypothetical protein n=1 Tax=Qipengyuania sp. JC766 TaxID=3232139 RepID=UPI0034576B6F